MTYEILYAFQASANIYGYFDCPYNTGRKVKEYKIGMTRASDLLNRVNREWSETLCRYRPSYNEVLMKRVPSGSRAEKEIDTFTKKLALKLKVKTLRVDPGCPKKEIFLLTFEELKESFDSVQGEMTTYKAEESVDNGISLCQKLISDEASEMTIKIGRNYETAHPKIKERIRLIFLNKEKKVKDVVCIKDVICKKTNKKSKSIRWVGGDFIVCKKIKESLSSKKYTLEDFKYDIKNNYISLVN